MNVKETVPDLFPKIRFFYQNFSTKDDGCGKIPAAIIFCVLAAIALQRALSLKTPRLTPRLTPPFNLLLRAASSVKYNDF
ncbi:hypothetical protein [Oscillibacter sp.]|uniref:hypothetical protein n=1 Tax=Oscillibacter sp. TaxID=1945593 RepID=UPI00289F895D|nr:hypothetical protein [Oscillibacter sp.]